MDKRGLSIIEFCAAYGISRATFYRMQADGTGPKTTRPRDGGKVLILHADIENWEHERRTQPTKENVQ